MAELERENMTFEDVQWERIQKANDSIETTDIKGKEYATVNQRVKAFRYVYPDGSISVSTDYIIGDEPKRIIKMTCTVSDGSGRVLATGTAEEKEASSYINKTSFIENCETSAVGRALGFAGFGIDTSIASKEEVENAIGNQEGSRKPTNRQIIDFRYGYPKEAEAKILKSYGYERIEDMPQSVIKFFIEERKDIIKERKARDDGGLDVNAPKEPFY